MKVFMNSVLVAMLVSVIVPQTVTAQRTGVEIWSQTCGNCHTIQPPDRYTASQWESIATHMKITARLTDEDTAAILDFLKSAARRLTVERARSPLHLAQIDAGFQSEEEGSGPRKVRDEGVDEKWLDAIDSEDIYKKLCVACHGDKGGGNGVAAVAFNPKPANFKSEKFQQSQTDKQLADAIANGKGSMPPFKGQLTDKEISDMVSYLRSMLHK